MDRRVRSSILSLLAGAAWLLPVPMMLIPRVAPFPRVFLPLLPLYALLVARGILHVAARLKLRARQSGKTASRFTPRRRAILTALALVLLLGWSSRLSLSEGRFAISDRIGGAYGDDFFAPHYLRNDFRPATTAAEILRRFPPAGNPVIYLSFNADPWALSFYCNIFNATSGRPDFRFDGPRGPVAELPDGAAVVLRQDESPEPVAQRFGGTLLPVAKGGLQHIIYQLKKP